MASAELCNLTLSEAQQALKENRTTSEALTQACLAQIDKYDDVIGAFLHVDRKTALNQARESDKTPEKQNPGAHRWDSYWTQR